MLSDICAAFPPKLVALHYVFKCVSTCLKSPIDQIPTFDIVTNAAETENNTS